jgi:hypothetical protein
LATINYTIQLIENYARRGLELKAAISSLVLPHLVKMTVDCSQKSEQPCMPSGLTNQALEAVGIHLNVASED